MVYFGDEVAEALDTYLDERLEMEPQEGNTEAVFLSMQNRRINVRSVENLVKKIFPTGNYSQKHYTA